jgi:hypothetical protein
MRRKLKTYSLGLCLFVFLFVVADCIWEREARCSVRYQARHWSSLPTIAGTVRELRVKSLKKRIRRGLLFNCAAAYEMASKCIPIAPFCFSAVAVQQVLYTPRFLDRTAWCTCLGSD